jgi:hypothetical protein
MTPTAQQALGEGHATPPRTSLKGGGGVPIAGAASARHTRPPSVVASMSHVTVSFEGSPDALAPTTKQSDALVHATPPIAYIPGILSLDQVWPPFVVTSASQRFEVSTPNTAQSLLFRQEMLSSWERSSGRSFVFDSHVRPPSVVAQMYVPPPGCGLDAADPSPMAQQVFAVGQVIPCAINVGLRFVSFHVRPPFEVAKIPPSNEAQHSSAAGQVHAWVPPPYLRPWGQLTSFHDLPPSLVAMSDAVCVFGVSGLIAQHWLFVGQETVARPPTPEAAAWATQLRPPSVVATMSARGARDPDHPTAQQSADVGQLTLARPPVTE